MNNLINSVKDKNARQGADKRQEEQGIETIKHQAEKMGAGLEEVVFRIEGICSCEAYNVEKPVRALKGVSSFSLNPFNSRITLRYDPSVVSVPDIQAAVKKAGANAVLMTS